MTYSHHFLQRCAIGLGAALSCSMLGMSAVQANEAVTFTLINSTNRVLEEFYASPPSTDDWEEDILGVDVLNPGESVDITIDDGRGDCRYDFKGVLGPGDGVGRGALIQSGVQVCNGDSYEYSN